MLIEYGLVLTVASLVASAAPRPETHQEQPIMMVVDAPEKPKDEPKLPPKPVERPIRVKTAQHIVPVPVPEPPPPIPAPTTSPIVEAPTPPPPPVPVPVTGLDKEAEFAARLKAAIQAAVSYPPAARNMGFRGKARVEFIFRNGSTHQVRVIQGSGIGMIDNAALAAVANAIYPVAPDSLKGKDMLYQVTVTFELNAGR
jgi:protein TonB